MSWSPEIAWESPAGTALRRLIAALPSDRAFALTLFGSAPLQLTLERTFLSNYVDLFVDEGEAPGEDFQAFIQSADLGEDQHAAVHVQLCTESNFRTSPRWRRRAYVTQVGRVRLTIPHPIDILMAKLHRLEEKDLRAFRLVGAQMGLPNEEQLKEELRAAVDLFRPNFDEEASGDITANTRVLWHELWGKEIDVRKEIIAPALAARRKGFEPDLPRRDYRGDLRKLADDAQGSSS